MFSKRLFRGGTAVPHRKTTADRQTIVMPPPPKVVIPLLQHVGVIAEPKVKKGDAVMVGQVLGDSDKTMSAPVHSSVSGTVTAVDFMLWAGGVQVASVEIETDGRQEIHPDVSPPVIRNKEEFLKAVRASGLVGLGGAGFPTHIKLNPPADRKIDTLIVNAAECEPYITSDYREIIENSGNVLSGIQLVMQNLGIPRCLIGIEDNKPDAILELKKLCEHVKNVSVIQLPTRYPQGAEKMLIWATTKRAVPAGKLPADVGVVVMNVTSVSFLAEYVKTGMPLIKKKVTVAGPCVEQPQNVEVLIGTSLADVFAFAGGFSSEPVKVIMGGPMMGVAQHTLDTNVVKQTNALLAFGREEGELPPSTACIRCGRCVSACPMGLLPLELNRSALKNDAASLGKLSVATCIECGSCSYVCPSKIHLVQAIRLGKTQVRIAAARASAQAAQGAKA
jgi:electron transport complex protein RnfC